MPLDLNDPRIDELARDVAGIEGISVAEAVRVALTDRRAKALAEREARVKERLARIRSMPVLDPTPADDALYDRGGSPR
jgi:hypothetical protein